jgi:phosphoribosylformimino-5-aminoimidazole carboxamide ribotide isomerase
MRVIPVIDLQGGMAVHGVQGARTHYRPVSGVLAPGGDARELARAYREQLGLTELYIADLNAIQGRGDCAGLVAELCASRDVAVMVDAGAGTLAQARRVLSLGAAKVVIGLETLPAWENLVEIRRSLPASQLVFSLDMRGEVLLAANPDLVTLSPLQILARLAQDGWEDVVLLDLARVGTGAGVDPGFLGKAGARYPELRLLAGGGVRDATDLRALTFAGAAGALVATALQSGAIDRAALAAVATAIPARTRQSGLGPPPHPR